MLSYVKCEKYGMNLWQYVSILCCLFCIVGSCVDPDVVHKAVGDSLELTADYPKDDLEVQWTYNGTNLAEYQKNYFKIVKPELFHERLKMNEDNISVTVSDLKLQDSGSFSIIAEGKSTQYKQQILKQHI